jgi:hypothetical protein
MLVSQLKNKLSYAPAKQTEGPPALAAKGVSWAYDVFKAVFRQSRQAISLTRVSDDVIVDVNLEWVNWTGFVHANEKYNFLLPGRSWSSLRVCWITMWKTP